jgi:cytochrome c oxidase subunit 2
MFSNASNFVQGVDKAFFIIFGISIFFLVTLTALMIYFVIKYNRKKGVKAVQVKDNMWLEFTWTLIPLILVLYMFYIGWEGFLPMRQVPKDAMPVKAIGVMWKWSFEYPGNKESDTLVLPINKPVKLDLVSKDVLHGLFIPAFRIKEDVVPVKKNYTWFIPGEYGEYDLYCSAFCGLSHSYMMAIVRIVPEPEFKKWLAALPVKKAVDENSGLKVLEKNGCVACHSVDGTKLVGPTFKGLYNSSRTVMTDGAKRTVKADEAYLKSAITNPNADVVDGYPQGVMKSYKDLISEKDIQKINDYLKSLESK